MAEHGFDETGISDDELTRLALEADPTAPIDPDAEPFVLGDRGAELLPAWYMPATMGATSERSRRRRAWGVAAVVAALVVVNGAGLCVTYGFPEIAW